MRRLIKVIVCVAVFVAACRLCQIKVWALEPEGIGIINEILAAPEMDKAGGVIDKTGALGGMSFSETVVKAITGELDLSLGSLAGALVSALLKEVKDFSALMRDMLIIAVLSAVFTALSMNLRARSAAELSFYAAYIMAMSILLESFSNCVGVLRDFTGELCRVVEACVPLTAVLLTVSGNPASAAVFNPIAVAAAWAAEFLIRDIAIPAIIFAAVLEIVNNISERDLLSRLAELIRKGVSIGLKSAAGLFVLILSLQRASAPILNGVALKAAKSAVGFVPVVGQALTGAVDAVAYWSGAVKNGTLVAAALAIFFLCLPAVIKLAAFAVIYKLTAALIQPICDKRFVNAVNAAGSLAALALGAAVLAAAVFIFMAMILISL